jgi:hypothetical protein
MCLPAREPLAGCPHVMVAFSRIGITLARVRLPI